jgi:hypothetical protein
MMCLIEYVGIEVIFDRLNLNESQEDTSKRNG